MNLIGSLFLILGFFLTVERIIRACAPDAGEVRR